MDYIIHGGADRIGGMCVEVSSDSGTRVLLDLGMPLYDDRGEDYPWGTNARPTQELLRSGVLPDVGGLYGDDPDAPQISAIVLTHAHLDHYGLAHHASPAIPVFGSEGTLALLEVGRVFFPDAPLPVDLRLLPKDEPMQIGDLTITALPVDHAAPDSRALLIEADGQRLLYTGDLRAHGRTGFRFDNLLADERLHGCDVLLIEGTTLGAPSGHGCRSETDVETELVELAKASPDKLVAVVASGQNVDRLVSCFRAARRSGRELVLDPYQAFVQMKLASLSTSIPQADWDGVRVCFAPHQYDRLAEAGLHDVVHQMARDGKVSTGELAQSPGRFLMLTRSGFGVTKVFDKVGAEHLELVWSQWGGYWKREGCAMREWTERRNVTPHFIHSGGHAWPEDLRRLVSALQPEETVWVHTEAGQDVKREAAVVDA